MLFLFLCCSCQCYVIWYYLNLHSWANSLTCLWQRKAAKAIPVWHKCLFSALWNVHLGNDGPALTLNTVLWLPWIDEVIWMRLHELRMLGGSLGHISGLSPTLLGSFVWRLAEVTWRALTQAWTRVQITRPLWCAFMQPWVGEHWGGQRSRALGYLYRNTWCVTCLWFPCQCVELSLHDICVYIFTIDGKLAYYFHSVW